MGSSYKRDKGLEQRRHAVVDADPPRCLWCLKVIPPPRRYANGVAYCTKEHSNLMQRQRVREKEATARATRLVPVEPGDFAEIRKGPVYQKIRNQLSDPEWEKWLDREISHVEISRRMGSTAQAIGRAHKAGLFDRQQQIAGVNWKPEKKYADMLGPPDADMAKLLADDPEAFEKALDKLVGAFVDWRTDFFRVGYGVVYITKDVHRRWIRATLKTIYTGGRQLTLSPPRHGKTDLLIHFCVWLICRNPNIRILWVGPNGDIAENCLGQVRDLLETHTELRDAYLPQGHTWAPERRAQTTWQRQRFTVANRTLAMKQPTMWCTGVGGKILSIDSDFIIVDDPADPDASQTPGGRDKIEKWFKIKLITRKMNHTGLVMISSRVHPEDLYSEFVDSENWEVVVDRAHDQSICHLGLWEEHKDPERCVLFPEINPLQYLREQADVVGDALFEMMYLNQPRPDGTLIFDPDLIRENCLDYSRDIGLEEIGSNYRLVAGLDPASRGVQAAFLWAVVLRADASPRNPGDKPVDKTVFHMVDLETQRAGGPAGAHAVMRDWFEKYGVTMWVVEDNAYQSVFFDDPRTKNLASELGLDIRPTHTGQNKHDPDFGVAGMAPLFHDGQVVLPYAGQDARRKTEAYIKQLINFTGDLVKKRGVSDILMASWFPHATVIKKWRKEARHEKVKQNMGASYPDYAMPTMNEVPWGGTSYPTS